MSRMNDRLALMLALFVPFSAVPVASNRPNWWLLWSALLAALALYQLARKQALEPRYRPRFMAFAGAFGLALVVPAWAVVQALPIAGLMPGALVRLREGMDGFALATVSVLPGAGLIGALRFVGYLVLLALVIETATRRDRVGRMATIIYLGVVAQALWALVALKMLGDYAFWGKTDYLGSATGTFINRNSLASFLGMGLVLGLGLAAHLADRPRGRLSRPMTWIERLGMEGVLLGIGMLIILLALYATRSRMGVIASLSGAMVTLALLRSANAASRARIAAEIGAVAFAVFVVMLLSARGDGLLERLLYVQRDGVNRLAIYAQTLELIRLRPLTGFGFDAFGPAFEAVRAPPLLQDAFYDLAHNSYLALWSETGLIVGSVPPLLLAWAGWQLWKARRRADGYSGLAAAGLGVLVLGAVHSVFDFSLEMPANVYLLLAIVGLGLGRNGHVRVARSDPEAAAADTSPPPPLPEAAPLPTLSPAAALPRDDVPVIRLPGAAAREPDAPDAADPSP